MDFRLAFFYVARKILAFMQSQEAAAEDILFKLWPWVEANLKRIAFVAGVIVIAVFAYQFNSYRQNGKEIVAGEALTQANMSVNGEQPVDAGLKIAAEYPGTLAGQRALLQGATALFTSGKYADAQEQFQKFLDTYPDSFFAPQATLGVATSLDALGKTDLAVSAYQKAAGLTSDANVTVVAKFSLARVDEAQGKLAEAAKLFGEISRTYGNTSLGAEAAARAVALNARLPKPAETSTSGTNAPFNLNH
jgi:predicted negative regulator of RcsB-dependent stress response